MDKENYNLDDILSEVKKRREENERLIRGEATPVEEAPAEEAPIEEVPVEEAPVEETPAAEPVCEGAPDPDDEAREQEEAVKEQMVNLLELSGDAQPTEKTGKKAPRDKAAKKGKHKKLKAVLLVLLVLLIAASVAGAIWANNALNTITDNNENVNVTETKWAGMDEDVDAFPAIEETEATDLASLEDMIKTWFYNGVPCSDSHVLNVMLVGEDTRGSEILDEGTRADSAIIASVNIDTKTITLTSILRDAYAYWETKPGDESTGQFGKINGAMSTGDINAYINCVENLYKINIDSYVIVNFDSFESIVDAMGGVNLTLTDAEINEINNHPKRYGNVTITKTFEGEKGKMKLNGKQALAYCRIRKLDSDNKRADRQKTCLIKIFEQAQKASGVKLLKIVNNMIPYVKTSFGKSEIVKIANYALTQGWLEYDVYTQNLPEHNLQGGIYFGGQWVWRPDFPADANFLQTLIYNQSSITLAHKRPDTKSCPETGFRANGAPAMTTYITNDHYGEATTVITTTKKSKESEKKD